MKEYLQTPSPVPATHICPKNPPCKDMLYLPLSCTNFCASPDLFTNNTEYQREYITKYFQSSSDYDVLNFMTEDGDSFPYATISSTLENKYLYEESPQPNFIQTDVGYIPLMLENKSVVDLSNIRREGTASKK